MNRKKSIFLSLVVIGVAATMITAATTAVFTDQVVSTNNELTAGTLDLAVDSQCDGSVANPTACPATFTWEIGTPDLMAIGDSVEHVFQLANVGSLPGNLTVTPLVTPTGTNVSGCFTLVGSTPPTALTADDESDGNGTDEGTYTITVTLDASGATDPPTDNDCQGATADIQVTFTLTQQP